jgi:hypothetical protein
MQAADERRAADAERAAAKTQHSVPPPTPPEQRASD